MNYFRDQIFSLPELIRNVIPTYSAEAARMLDPELCCSIDRLVTVGCGDSCFAALATELAFEMIAGVPTEAQNAMTFSRYGVEFAAATSNEERHGRAVVIGISVSGGVTRTIEAMLRARSRGLTTIAITGSAATPIAQAAGRALITQVPDAPNAAGVQVPGARSYFASLLMLYVSALQMAEARGREVGRWRADLEACAEAAQRTIEMSDGPSRRLAEQLLDASTFVMCGSGPNFATAHFCAAKIVEASGDSAIGQDVEEWAHVQYFAKEVDTPTFLISAYERDASRAAEVKTAMQAIGRCVIEVRPRAAAHADAADEADAGQLTFRLHYADCPEVFAPLVAPIPVMLFAAYRAELLGEPYFRGFGGGRSIEHGGGISRIRTSELVV